MDLKQLLDDFKLPLQAADRVWVAYSGGLDSTVLLHAAVELLGADKVGALHLNHQLQIESNDWQKQCQQQADVLGVEFRSALLEVANKGQGIEEEARRLRYEFFRKNLDSGQVLLLGHHADDQAETLLYRLFRGSGVRGLSAIPKERIEGRAQLVRPFLEYSKEQLMEVAVTADLDWIEDPSNSDISYDRNYIRRNVLPPILGRWPAAKLTLARAASNLRGASVLLDEYADYLLQQCQWRKEDYGHSFDIFAYQQLSEQAQALLLDRALAQLGLGGFDSNYREKVAGIIGAVEDARPLLLAGESEMRRYAGRLYLMSSLKKLVDTEINIQWSGTEPLEISGCCKILALDDYSGEVMSVTFRKGGERCKPLGRSKSQSLKKLMQEYDLVPWLRDQTPLVWRDGKLAAAAGLFSCEPDLSVPRVVWQKP